MSEVEKMYENAGVEKQYYYFDSADGNTYTWELNENGNDKHNMCFIGKPKIKDREFTAEKQLELVKWCCKKCRRFYLYNINDIDNFAENLAKEFNHYWQDLTESEQEQIRSILK